MDNGLRESFLGHLYDIVIIILESEKKTLWCATKYMIF